MLFSDYYGIKYMDEEEWFDPILTQDTRLFIDPFAVFKSQDDLFKDSYSEIMYFFQIAFEFIAHAGGNKNSLNYKKAVNMLIFHEENAFCLGYSKTRKGSGTGIAWAKLLAENISSIIAKGIINISHFEELGIFCPGIGPDRLSDMTANLLKNRFITYTQRICNLYKIPMQKVRIQNAFFDYEFSRWISEEYLLPTNPYKENTPVILVPKNFLSILPEINSDDFQRTMHLSEVMRNDLNYEIDKNLDKDKIAEIAIQNYDLVKAYIDLVEQREPCTFDSVNKKTIRYLWYSIAKKVVTNVKFEFGPINNDSDFFSIINRFSNYFKDYIELKSGYKLLWDEERKKNRSEEDVQILFRGILDEHCRANNIDLNREINQGMGPVDFKFSNGYSKRVLLEVKLAHNTKLWNGLQRQLPRYMRVETCKYGIFLVIAFTDNDIQRINNIQDLVRETEKKYNITLKTIIVDARLENKQSASKL